MGPRIVTWLKYVILGGLAVPASLFWALIDGFLVGGFSALFLSLLAILLEEDVVSTVWIALYIGIGWTTHIFVKELYYKLKELKADCAKTHQAIIGRQKPEETEP